MPEPGPRTGSTPDPGAPPRVPRWVPLLGLVAVLLGMLVLVLHLTGTSIGGPGSHLGSAEAVSLWP